VVAGATAGSCGWDGGDGGDGCNCVVSTTGIPRPPSHTINLMAGGFPGDGSTKGGLVAFWGDLSGASESAWELLGGQSVKGGGDDGSGSGEGGSR